LFLGTSHGLLGSARADTWYVEADGSGDTTSVQGGMVLASAGDTVLVGPGTYFEDIDFLGKDVVLKSRLGPSVTILDGTGQDSSIVILKREETRAAVLEGFTLTNGSGTSYNGGPREGGAIFSPNASVAIRGNHIIGNHADWGGGILVGKQHNDPPFPSPLLEGNLLEANISANGGGGIFVFRSHATVVANTFRGNKGNRGDGGGINTSLQRGNCSILENEFWNNEAGDQGGGIFAYTSSGAGPVGIEGNLIVGNVAHGASPHVLLNGAGGGIAAWTLNGSIRNNTISDNEALPTGGCTGGGLRILGTSTLSVELNIIANNLNGGIACYQDPNALPGTNLLWENSAGNFNSCASTWEGASIVADPYFCNRALGDYRVAADSPALANTQPIGAFPESGCAPVPVYPTTWGRLKSLYQQ
jgi:hypothetical protein